MKEMFDGRMKVHEQLEVTVSNLEEKNARLVADATNDKNKIQM